MPTLVTCDFWPEVGTIPTPCEVQVTQALADIFQLPTSQPQKQGEFSQKGICFLEM